MSEKPRLAVVGCGAVIAERYIGAFSRSNWAPAVLIDPSQERRREIAGLLKSRPEEASSASAVLDKFDAAIVAVPHQLHEPVCVELLAAGKHVLVEKPMASSISACDAMNAAARNSGAKLAIALMRRQSKSGQWLKDAISAQAFGVLRKFVIREGYEYAWPLASDSMWRPAQSGGGVLMDTGAHTMDQIVWWFGTPDEIEYFDDNDGGVEADALVRMRWKSGLEGVVELSRTRRLSNALHLHTDRGVLTMGMAASDVVGDNQMLEYASPRVGNPPFGSAISADFFITQMNAFADYIAGKDANVVDGEEGAKSVALIAQCYSVRRPLEMPWISYTRSAA